MKAYSPSPIFRKAQIILITLRAAFFPASALPVAVGAILAFQKTGHWHWGLFGWTLVGAVSVHAAANVANDYFDHLSGNDEINRTFIRPFSGGSRTIQKGLITPRQVAALACICLALALIAAARLAYLVGPLVLLPAAVGVLGGYFYSAPPLRLASRGWGEAVVGLNFGILPVVGAYYVQTGMWSWKPVLVSLPIAVLVVAILFVNQFPDFEADRAVGKCNWVVRLGRPRSAVLYALLMAAWLASLLLAVWPGGAPKAVLLGLAGVLLAIPAARIVFAHHDTPEKMAPACALTISLHTATGIVMCAAMLKDVIGH